MYHSLKKAFQTVFGNKLLFSVEWPIRSLVALFYAGNKVACALCGDRFRKFISIRHEDFTDHICPKCGSIARKRLLWLYVSNELKAEEKGKKWLHFSPHRYFARKMKRLHGASYITTDYESNIADKQYDITNIEMGDNSLDVVICYHVLEHVPNDAKAMTELFRVLKPGGTLLAQVPHQSGKTIEDPTVTSPEERLEKFGQEDHVRWYGTDDFVQRLTLAGFKVEKENYSQRLQQEQVLKNKLNTEEIIFVCTKPA